MKILAITLSIICLAGCVSTGNYSTLKSSDAEVKRAPSEISHPATPPASDRPLQCTNCGIKENPPAVKTFDYPI